MASRKITVEVPEEILQRALEATGEGVTGTVRRGLEAIAAVKAGRALRRLRGKVKFSIDLGDSRADRP